MRASSSHTRWRPDDQPHPPRLCPPHQQRQGRYPNVARCHVGSLVAVLVLGVCFATVGAQAPIPISVQLALPQDLPSDFKITYISTLSLALEVVSAWPCEFEGNCPRFSLAPNSPAAGPHVTVRMCNGAYAACEDKEPTPAQVLIGMAAAEPVPGSQQVALCPTLQRTLNTSMQLLYKLGYTKVALITAPSCAPQATPLFPDIRRAAQLHKLEVAINPGFSCAAFVDAHMHVFLFAPHSLEDAAAALRDLDAAGLLDSGHMYLTSPYFNDFDLTELEYYMSSEAAIMETFKRVVVSLTLAQGDEIISERVASIRAQAVRVPRIIPRFLTPEHTPRTAALWDAAVFLARALRAPNANGTLPCALDCGQLPCITKCFDGLASLPVAGAASQDFMLSPLGTTAHTELLARRPTLPPFQQVVATATMGPPTSNGDIQEEERRRMERSRRADASNDDENNNNGSGEQLPYDLVVFRDPATSAPVSAPLFYFFPEAPSHLPPDAGPTIITVGVVYGRSIQPTLSLAAAFDAVVAGAREFYATQHPGVQLVILTRAAADNLCDDAANKLIDEGVHALIGGITTQCTINLAAVAASRNVLHFSVTASMTVERSPQFVNTFQLGAMASDYVGAMTRILQMANVSCVSVVFDASSDLHRGQAEKFIHDVEPLGIDVITTTDVGQTSSHNSTFWEDVLSMLHSDGASTIVLFVFPVDASMLLFEGSKQASSNHNQLWLANHVATATNVFPAEVKAAFDRRFVGVHTSLRPDFEEHPFLSFPSTTGHQSFASTLHSRRSVILAVDAVHILFWAADRARFVHNFSRSKRNQREALQQQMPQLTRTNAIEGFSVQRLWFHNSSQRAIHVDVVSLVDDELEVVTRFCACDLDEPASQPTTAALPPYFVQPPCRAAQATTTSPVSSGSGSTNAAAISAAIALSVVVLLLLVTFRVYLRQQIAKRGLRSFDFAPLMRQQPCCVTKPPELSRHIVVSEERLNEGAFGMVYRGYLKDPPPSLLHNVSLVYITPGSSAPERRRAGSTSPAFANTPYSTAESPLPDDGADENMPADPGLRGGGGSGGSRDGGGAAGAAAGRYRRRSTPAEGMDEEDGCGVEQQRPREFSRASYPSTRRPTASSATGVNDTGGRRRTMSHFRWRNKPRRFPCVAIKQCKYIHNNADTMQLMQEALYLQALKDCRNVVRLVGVLTADERPSMVLEYCKYGSLDNFLRQKCLLGVAVSWRIKARMLTHVALGLHAVHKRSIVHCDIACRNILVGRNLVCKICDFGAARAGPVNRSPEGNLPNVPLRWTAPEVLRHATYSFFSDVWSFGTLVWEVASNAMVTPYHNLTTQAEVVQAIYKEQHLDINPQWPKQLQDLLTLCWKPILQRPTMTAVVHKAYDFRSWARTSEFEIRGLAADVAAGLHESRNSSSSAGATKAAGVGARAGSGTDADRGGSLLSQSLTSSALLRSRGPPHTRASLRGDCMYASSDEEQEAEVLQTVLRGPIELDAAAVVASPSNLNQLVSSNDAGAYDATEEEAMRKHTPSPRGEYARLDVSRSQQLQHLLRQFGTRESGIAHPEYFSLRTGAGKQQEQKGQQPRGVTRAARSLPFFDDSTTALSRDNGSRSETEAPQEEEDAIGSESEVSQDDTAGLSGHGHAERPGQSEVASVPFTGADGDMADPRDSEEASHKSSVHGTRRSSSVLELQPSRYGALYCGPFTRNENTCSIDLGQTQQDGAAQARTPAAPVAQTSRTGAVLYGNEEEGAQEATQHNTSAVAAPPPLAQRDRNGSMLSDMDAADTAAMHQLQADRALAHHNNGTSGRSSTESGRNSSVV